MIYKRIPLDDHDKNAFLEVYVADPIQDFIRKAILVIPGGGYGFVSDREGEPIAMAFMPYGFNAFVLHYSVGEGAIFPKQLIQASKAMKHIKDNAKEYNIDPNEVFAVGFSAGGHLTGSLGILWDNEQIYKEIEMEYGYNKPKGIMLIYPVITNESKEVMHEGSFINLLGDGYADEKKRTLCSLEKQVNSSSSPAFIMHTYNDNAVPVKNALYIANAYVDAGVPCELHIYPDGPHGIALANKITKIGVEKFENESIAKWVENAVFWAENI